MADGEVDSAGGAAPPWVPRATAAHALAGSAPLGLFLGSAAFDLASHRATEVAFARPSFWLLVLGIALGVLTGLPGLALALALPAGSARRRAALVHVVLTDLALVAFALSAVMRKGTFPDEPVEVVPAVVSVLGLGLLVAGRVSGLRIGAASPDAGQNNG